MTAACLLEGGGSRRSASALVGEGRRGRHSANMLSTNLCRGKFRPLRDNTRISAAARAVQAQAHDRQAHDSPAAWTLHRRAARAASLSACGAHLGASHRFRHRGMARMRAGQKPLRRQRQIAWPTAARALQSRSLRSRATVRPTAARASSQRRRRLSQMLRGPFGCGCEASKLGIPRLRPATMARPAAADPARTRPL